MVETFDGDNGRVYARHAWQVETLQRCNSDRGFECEQTRVEKIKWEHGRRNFSLRRNGLLSIVCPVSGGGSIVGIGIFNASVDEVKKIMDEDPAVREDVLRYQVLDCRSFPGDCLPK